MKNIRLGVVGAGFISREYHCPALRRVADKNPELVLAAICDLNKKRAADLASRFGFAASYSDCAAMLDEEKLDGTYILTDPGRIKEAAMPFIVRKIPLLIEKPPGNSLAQVQDLLRELRRHQIPHLVALNRRFMPLVARTKELIEQQGSAHFIDAVMVRYRREDPDFAYGTGIHAIDVLRFLLGEVARVEVEKTGFPGNQRPAFQADFHFASGARGKLTILPEAGLECERYTVHGHDYTITVETPLEWTVDYPGRILFFSGRNRHFVQDNRAFPAMLQDRLEITGFLGETVRFTDFLLRGQPMSPTLEEALQSIEIAEAVSRGKTWNSG